MSDDKSNESLKKTTVQKTQKRKSGYGGWLFRKEGTVAEPWPTAKQLWEDPNIQKVIQRHNSLVRKKNGS